MIISVLVMRLVFFSIIQERLTVSSIIYGR